MSSPQPSRRPHRPAQSPTEDALTRQLRAALSARADLAPSVDLVRGLARATSVRRARRRRVVAVGGVALSVVGLVGAVVSATVTAPGTAAPTAPSATVGPATQPQQPSPEVQPLPATTEPCPLPAVSATADTLAAAAFTTAGYTTDDAWYLAAFWAVDCTTARVKGGAAVQSGVLLPVAPGASPPRYDTSTATGPAAQQAFTDAGYGPDDSAALAALWGYPDPVQAQSKAGLLLLAGRPVPIDTAREDAAAAGERMQAFYGSGYTFDDAQALAQLWSTNVDTAKTRAGADLLASRTLPRPPSGSTAQTTD